ncbi:Glycoside hydrolase [Apiospora marii]|uniref:Glycoside hydrolase n=1 Tax=Apiospora marii TaxID=335849 RepID=A0ABR1S8B2_9PEZI
MFSFTRFSGLLALLSSAALAANMQHLSGTQYENKCTYTTWVDETTNDSPLADDCMKVAKPFADAHQGWFFTDVTPTTFQLVGWHGTCAFGVRPVTKGGKTNFFFGSTDVYDLIFDATMRFKKTRSGKIGASGVTRCDDTQVNWKIFRRT